uniref:Uncharacterized protein n=1 Tax=Wenling levi-like virus 2 TaxID=1923498 RepID=A0A1L3KIL4_9VIRU|nr:hypothetical protein [Wenling levi-like virus 2]
MALNTKDFSNAVVSYSMFRLDGNRAVYIGPAHSDLVKDQVILNSTAPKQSAQSYGNRRGGLNIVQTIKVATPQSAATISRDMKLEALASVPVGATYDEFKELVARMAGLLGDETYVKGLFLTGKIDYHA